MKYRVTCLTPTLVGDGLRLSPIDYMVWRDQVNVLDQRRIFQMLAKGSRLDTYLTEIRRAEKLRFAEWGGYAQNYAERRVPLEHPSLAGIWEAARPDFLHIPTFAAAVTGPYLPGSALRGALRTALTWQRWKEHGFEKVAAQAAERVTGDRVPRRLAQSVETIGGKAAEKAFSVGDGKLSGALKIYYLRTARLEAALSWRDSPPSFAEMADPGTSFSGAWTGDADACLRAANLWSVDLLEIHLAFAKKAGLAPLIASLEGLRFKAVSSQGGCLLPLGWGAGLLSKIGISDAGIGPLRTIWKALPLYNRAVSTGLPFPKTRRVVHLNQQPTALPGWVWLEIDR